MGGEGHDRRGGRNGCGGCGGRRRSGRPRRLLLIAGALFLLVIGATAPASAHAALRTSDPADGVLLTSAPRYVTLAFTEPVGLLTDSFRVYDPRNHRVRTSGPDHVPGRSGTVRVPLPGGLGSGTYTVAWRVVSADSHPVSGALTFSVGRRTAAPAGPPAAPAENPLTAALHTIARYLAHLGLAVLLGTAAFVAYCRPPVAARPRTPVRAAWWTVLGSTTALFLLRAPYEEGTSPTHALARTALARTATSRPGELLLARLALLLLVAACAVAPPAWRSRLPRRAVLAAGTVLSVALCLTWAAAGHAAAGPRVPLAVASATLHLLAMAAWLGGLTALPAVLRATGPDHGAPPVEVLTRFSRLASAAVTVLVLTGLHQSWRGLGSWPALTGTPYGRLLLVKLAAVTLLLAAAARSRRWATRPVPPPVYRNLRRSVSAELAVGVVVLALTTLLTGTPPGRAAAGAPAAGASAAGIPVVSVTAVPFDVGTPGGRGTVQLTLDPGRVGPNSVQAVVYGPDGGLSAVPGLRVTLTLPARRIGPLDARVTDRGGYWAADSFAVPIPGRWIMRVTVRVSEVDQVTVSRPVRVTR